ncbi:MAG: dihydropteroate synthase [Candidatus Omnitrophota bacterium]
MAAPARKMIWNAGKYDIYLGERTLVMGIVNVTPDSFSGDGVLAKGRTEKIPGLALALKLARDGADILDIGGASSRPGAVPPMPREEAGRVVPLIAALSGRLDIPLSVDTASVLVAVEALQAGASIVNLIQGTPADVKILRLVAEAKAGLVLMHMRGNSKSMQSPEKTAYQDLIREVKAELRTALHQCLVCGIKKDRIVIDPGIGFSKTPEQNLLIMRRLSEFIPLGRPVLVGTSRKSFIGHVLGNPEKKRLIGTAVTVAVAAMSGIHIVRVHDVLAMKQAVMMADAIRATM